MKLIHKPTGEVWDVPKMRHPTAQEDDISFFAMLGTRGALFSYHSLAELNANWEDYAPKEPLIKDEKIRNAVRAWAEANDFAEAYLEYDYNRNCPRFSLGATSIEFYEYDEDIETKRTYTIAELCGEGEE